MELTESDLQSLSEIAIQAAKKAGQIIENYDRTKLVVGKKNIASSLAAQVVTELDLLSQQAILKILSPTCTRYDLAVLAEEDADETLASQHPRHHKDYFWCIDPLDGTLPYTENSPGYAVAIALVARDGRAQLGVVYEPREKTLYHAIIGKGAYKNEREWILESSGSNTALTFITDRSFTSTQVYAQTITGLEEIAAGLGYSGLKIIDHGGAVMNACWVLENAPASYFKFPKSASGGGSLWDFAASACIASEAGAITSDIHATSLDLNRRDSLFMNHRGVLFASHQAIAEHVIQLYQRIKCE